MAGTQLISQNTNHLSNESSRISLHNFNSVSKSKNSKDLAIKLNMPATTPNHIMVSNFKKSYAQTMKGLSLCNFDQNKVESSRNEIYFENTEIVNKQVLKEQETSGDRTNVSELKKCIAAIKHKKNKKAASNFFSNSLKYHNTSRGRLKLCDTLSSLKHKFIYIKSKQTLVPIRKNNTTNDEIQNKSPELKDHNNPTIINLEKKLEKKVEFADLYNSRSSARKSNKSFDIEEKFISRSTAKFDSNLLKKKKTQEPCANDTSVTEKLILNQKYPQTERSKSPERSKRQYINEKTGEEIYTSSPRESKVPLTYKTSISFSKRTNLTKQKESILQNQKLNEEIMGKINVKVRKNSYEPTFVSNAKTYKDQPVYMFLPNTKTPGGLLKIEEYLTSENGSEYANNFQGMESPSARFITSQETEENFHKNLHSDQKCNTFYNNKYAHYVKSKESLSARNIKDKSSRSIPNEQYLSEYRLANRNSIEIDKDSFEKNINQFSINEMRNFTTNTDFAVNNMQVRLRLNEINKYKNTNKTSRLAIIQSRGTANVSPMVRTDRSNYMSFKNNNTQEFYRSKFKNPNYMIFKQLDNKGKDFDYGDLGSWKDQNSENSFTC